MVGAQCRPWEVSSQLSLAVSVRECVLGISDEAITWNAMASEAESSNTAKALL